MKKSSNYYEILGIDPKATAQQIKEAYRTLARRYHPDLNPQDSDSADKFRIINEAYRILSDQEQRSHYDYINFEPPNANPDSVGSPSPKSASGGKNEEAFFTQGLKNSQLGNYKEAIKNYNQAIAINQNYADAYNKRGLCFYKLGEPSEAIKDFTKALYINSKIPDAYYNRGMARFKLGYAQAAIEDYTAA